MIRLEALSQAHRPDLHDWPRSAAHVVTIKNFLDDQDALTVLDELEHSSSWERSWYVSDPGHEGKIRQVDEAAFHAASTHSSDVEPFWFSTVQTISASVMSSTMPACAKLRSELLDPAFSHAMTDLLGRRVTPASDINAAKYEAGDFLRAHQDNFDGWIGSLIIYASRQPWTDTDGGRLGFRKKSDVSYTRPAHNTACVIPLTNDNSHWVEPVTNTSRSRLSFNLHFGTPTGA